MIMVVKKQAPTPKISAQDKLAYPRNGENIMDPKARMVVRDVRKTALPVLESTIKAERGPSRRQRWTT